jgi:hypothetical protein
MADVRAGVGQPTIASGGAGIVTLWVRSESEPAALDRGSVVLAARGYAEVGPLRSYLEEMVDDPLAPGAVEDRIVGYDAIKQQALTHGDGLYEVWLAGIREDS